jgi:hypothetical protein
MFYAEAGRSQWLIVLNPEIDIRIALSSEIIQPVDHSSTSQGRLHCTLSHGDFVCVERYAVMQLRHCPRSRKVTNLQKFSFLILPAELWSWGRLNL